MKKKKTTQPQQPVNPENYIRQKSRKLPIDECFINNNWEESKICSVTITRKHATGNVTVCIYLVDLACLGVKDTAYRFNISPELFEEMLKSQRNRDMVLVNIPYELAHNIIHAGLEFAEEYGFKPCKDFTSTTRFFLEEDTDNIPLIEIPCGGKDGKPLYVNTGFDPPAVERRILAQLEKTAGEGNYHYLLGVRKLKDFDEEAEDNEDEDDEDAERLQEIVEDLDELSPEERENMFIELALKEKNKIPMDEDDITRFLILANYLAFKIVGLDAIKEQLELFNEKFEHEIVRDDEFPNSLFGDFGNMDKKTVSDLFGDIIKSISDNENSEEAIAAFREKVGDAPIVDFWELHYLSKNDDEKDFCERLEKYYRKNPNNFLIQVYWYARPTNKKDDNILEKMEKLLSEKKEPISEFEAEFYFFFYGTHLLMNKNTELSTILAFEEYFEALDFISDDKYEKILTACKVVKLTKIVEHFERTGAF